MTRAAGLVLAATLVSLGSFGCSGGSGGGPDLTDFGLKFTRIAPSGYVDMSLDFENPTRRPVTLRGRLVALDQGGVEIPRVKVTTAFGTEAGRTVVMPGGAVDFAQFHGEDSEMVRDVAFRIVSVSNADVPVLREFVDLVPLDQDGNDLEYDSTAQQVRLENPNAESARIRIVLMVLAASHKGIPQQAILVRDVTTVSAKGNASTVVDLDPKTRSILRERGTSSFVTLRPVLSSE